jgi:hypothetical protein
MIKKLLGRLFNKKAEPQRDKYIISQLNDKLMPIDRGNVYEDPLNELLKQKLYGEVSGGGTLLSKSNEIEYCDVEIKLREEELNRDAIAEIIDKLEELGAPKGSKLIIESTGAKIEFGKLEGLALYLDGVNLPDEVYKNSNPNTLIAEIMTILKMETEVIRYWHGNTESAMYFYGLSFAGMKTAIADLVNSNPECENARIVQIA